MNELAKVTQVHMLRGLTGLLPDARGSGRQTWQGQVSGRRWLSPYNRPESARAHLHSSTTSYPATQEHTVHKHKLLRSNSPPLTHLVL